MRILTESSPESITVMEPEPVAPFLYRFFNLNY